MTEINKTFYTLAFDEFIGNGSKLEGNTRENAISELDELIQLLIEHNIVTDQIDNNLLMNFKMITEQIKNMDDYYFKKNLLEKKLEELLIRDNFYLLGGWIGHGILFFLKRMNIIIIM